MDNVYCVKDGQKTPNVKGSQRVVVTKNGRNLLKVKCSVCGKTKTRFLPKTSKKLTLPSQLGGNGSASDTLITGAEFAIKKSVPFIAKNAVEDRRFYASEALRNKKLQQKAIDCGMKMATPIVNKVGHELIDRFSTVIRPSSKYKTDRPDLDCEAVSLFPLKSVGTNAKLKSELGRTASSAGASRREKESLPWDTEVQKPGTPVTAYLIDRFTKR